MRDFSMLMGGLLGVGCFCAGMLPVLAASPPYIITVPMRLELNRPYIEVELAGSNGLRVQALAWVDTGGGAIILSDGLAKRLGLKPTANPGPEEGHTIAPTMVPQIHIGDMPIQLTNARAFIATDVSGKLEHTNAEMALPGRMLRKYIVVLDYPAHRFTIAMPGGLHPQGVAVKSYIGKSGMPVVWLSVTGTSHAFLMDTGGQFCMMSENVLHRWEQKYPNWRRIEGAYGPADMLLGKDETKFGMLRIEELQWGPFHIAEVGAVSRPVGTYEKWMSQIVSRPIVGSIGGNVLRAFRVTVDYPAGRVYLKQEAPAGHTSINMVGVTLESVAQSGYQITGVADGVRGIQTGDRLLKVDGENVSRAPFYKVLELLSGKPGETRRLTLLRNGEQLTVTETVKKVL